MTSMSTRVDARGPIAVFYHCYATEQGVRYLDDFLAAIEVHGLYRHLALPVQIGVVGPVDGVERTIKRRPHTAILDHALSGFEHLTLNHVAGYVENNDGCVLYAHSKGASVPTTFNDVWRTSMTRRLVEGWDANVGLLERDGYDAVGCHWLCPAEWPGPPVTDIAIVGNQYFGGNFWWASTAYLRKLPNPVSDASRHEAEVWIGKEHPRVYDLAPRGWPGYDTFRGPPRGPVL